MHDMAKLNQVSGRIIEGALRVHSRLGPGVFEPVYEACLEYELGHLGMTVERQKAIPVLYDEVRLDCGFRLDLLVEDLVVVELKAVESLLPVHHAQLLSYLRLSGKPLGLLINFHEAHLRDGIHRKITIPPPHLREPP